MIDGIEKGLVSVVTPVWNGESYLSRFLDSVIRQTYKPIQLIVSDDGSTDDTFGVFKSYETKLSEAGIDAVYVYGKHQNQSAALNRVLPLVRGEYFAWPDADDVLSQDSVAERVSFLEENSDYECVRSLICYFGPAELDEENIGDIAKEDIFFDLLFGKTYVSPGAYMFRTKALLEIYPDGQIPISSVGQNFQILLPVLYKYPCKTLPKMLYGIYKRSDSHSRRELSFAEQYERFNEYGRLLQKIIDITPIDDPGDIKLIKAWEIERKVGLCLRSNRPDMAISTLKSAMKSGVYCWKRFFRRLFIQVSGTDNVR